MSRAREGAISYWIQHPDYSITERTTVDVSDGVRAYQTHDWRYELELHDQIEAKHGDACRPGIGFVGPSATLHVCPNADGRASTTYTFDTRRKILGILPLTIPKSRTVDDVTPQHVRGLLEKFFAGEHESLLAELERIHRSESGRTPAQAGFWTKPFTTMMLSAGVAYLVMLAVALIVFTRRGNRLDGAIAVQSALAAVVVGFGMMPLFTGVVELDDVSFPRRTKPSGTGRRSWRSLRLDSRSISSAWV